jgi:hypothetical protein
MNQRQLSNRCKLARTSLCNPGSGRLYVAMPGQHGGKGPHVRVYQAKPRPSPHGEMLGSPVADDASRPLDPFCDELSRS